MEQILRARQLLEVWLGQSSRVFGLLLAFNRFFRWRVFWRHFVIQTFKLGNSSDSTQRSQPDTMWLLINLDRRPDRLQESEMELSAMGLSWSRIRASYNENGALGCARSHISALETIHASDESFTYVIAEDDVQFISDSPRLHQTISNFLCDGRLDVLCLSFRTQGIRFPISPHLSIANQLLTTGAYIPKRHAVEKLLNCFRESEEMLAKGLPKEVAAIDVLWQDLQLKELLFAVPRSLSMRQRESYSDVAKKHALYDFR